MLPIVLGLSVIYKVGFTRRIRGGLMKKMKRREEVW